jgi:hypothetical protein
MHSGADETRVVMRKSSALNERKSQVPRAKRQARLIVAVSVVKYSQPTCTLLVHRKYGLQRANDERR